MCLGNRAHLASHYLNKQYETHWENSHTCLSKHGTGLKPTNPSIEYGTCLAEYYHGFCHNKKTPSKDDMSFYANFGAPKLEFVCNHDAVLYLDLQEGHFNCDTRTTTPLASEHHRFKSGTVAFRLEFKKHVVHNISSEVIGSKKYDLQLIVLDIATAKLCTPLCNLQILSDSHERREQKLQAITYYMTSYLDLFKRAGYHVLHGLPDFDSLATRTDVIDYSMIGISAGGFHDAPRSFHGIDLEIVNLYLKRLWHDATSYIDEWESDEHGDLWDSSEKFCLVEHKSVWNEIGDGVYDFHVQFRPPTIQMLCRDEVVLFLDVESVTFFLGDSEEENFHRFSDWKIGVIVDLALKELDEGCVKKIVLDFQTQRFCPSLSRLEGPCEDVVLFEQLKTSFIRYLTTYYLSIIESVGYDVVYHQDIRVKEDTWTRKEKIDVIVLHGEEGYEEEVHGCECESEEECTHISSHGYINWGEISRKRHIESDTMGYDFVTAVTQGSINAHFKEIWASHHAYAKKCGETWSSVSVEEFTCLAEWSYFSKTVGHSQALLNASFFAPRVQLVTRKGASSVIFYVNVSQGSLKFIDEKTKRCSSSMGDDHVFSGWRLAFEVKLELVDTDSECGCAPESIFKQRGNREQSGLKQLVLNFSTAKLIQKLSYLSGFYESENLSNMRRKRQAMVHYIKEHYFKVLQRAGHHVLYTLPTRSKEVSGCHPFTPATIDFEIYPFVFGEEGRFVEGVWGEDRLLGNRNMIVFIGMLQDCAFPHRSIPRSINWVCDIGYGKSLSEGTVCLSRELFLEKYLLTLLGKINAATTIVPRYAEVEDGIWRIDLTTWDRHESKKKKECKWKQVDCGDDLGFQWYNKNEWSYKHEGDGDCESDGVYSIACVTTNKLRIPTTQRREGVEISISGDISLQLKVTGEKKKASTYASARWEATIYLSSTSRGIKVHVTPDVIPEFYQDESDCLDDFNSSSNPDSEEFDCASDRLRMQLPEVISFDNVLTELKDAVEGIWGNLYSTSGREEGRNFCVTRPAFNKRGDVLFELGSYVALEEGRIAGALTPRNGSFRLGITSTPGSGKGRQGLPSFSEGDFPRIEHRPGDSTSETLDISITGIRTSTTGVDTPLHTPPLGKHLSEGSDVRVVNEGEVIVENIFGNEAGAGIQSASPQPAKERDGHAHPAEVPSLFGSRI